MLPPHPATATAAATTAATTTETTVAPERRTATRRRSAARRVGLEIAVPIAGSAIVICVSVAAAVLRDATGGSRRRRRCSSRCGHRGGRGCGCRCRCRCRCTRRSLGLRHLNRRRARWWWWWRRRAHDKDPARFHRRIVGERRHESIAARGEVFQRVASGAGPCPAAVECVPEGMRAAGRGIGHGYVYGHRLTGLSAAVRRQDAEVWFRWWGALGRCDRGDRCGGGRGAG